MRLRLIFSDLMPGRRIAVAAPIAEDWRRLGVIRP